ncbi:3-deoxy-manno-octulosonate cytidylyltransferase (CMP-KDO synthetase) [Jezberella montanilacus]|jgi:3-deoxy-manno-octulosonate cytidylyltransferase (CMP-KDO synthetase)|uniref:3-deoxy-manno-octulosonate cytidylyltransferase n=1 Tax=Jezberella montanilacus TaxID=323426 RepID=A0A2T0XJQ2_9BURK|nr:3-deoxy-manno-octulosonate cytidylyltransferase [Jezberella montanilacus]PRY99110.1 3-deoxy-manno-octulosonate cytidylyltransferase (CMP-KDO synthetase) [Jezberella montanilacus]
MISPFSVIIPARHASTRLPGKMLADLAGVPMVVRVAQRALLSNAGQVVIATDHPDIVAAAAKFDITALLTSTTHLTGTDRLAQAAESLGLGDHDIVVNVQGDEPLIEPAMINAVAQCLADHPNAHIATCAAPIQDAEALFNPNVVKVVCDAKQQALYFSRAPIPWHRDVLANGAKVLAPDLPALHHIGLYAYRCGFLSRFPTLSPGILETIESLEQLRALENGYQIAVKILSTRPFAGVDTEEDLVRVRSILERSV